MPHVIWTGAAEGSTFRVLDMDAPNVPRVRVEIQLAPDLLGGQGWGRFDPIPIEVFSAILVASGVVV